MPADTFTVPGFSIKVAGSPLPKSVADAVMTVEVQQSLELIDMFTIVLDNDHGQIGDSDLFKEGNEVEIELGYSGEPEKLMKGEIISLEPTWPEDTSPTLLVRGYDRVHRLSRGRKTRSFLQVKVSDVVQQLAGEEGISAEVDDTELVHEYLFQNNQTNIELIYQLARRHFFEVDLDLSGTLNFKKPSSNKPKSFTLKWGHDLKSFYVRESVTEVPTSVTTMGWDPKQKQAITHKTTDLQDR